MELKLDSGETLAKDKRTFFWDNTLPSLPLPSIHQTIEKYLDSCKASKYRQEIFRLLSNFHKSQFICVSWLAYGVFSVMMTSISYNFMLTVLTDDEYKETERVCKKFTEDEAMNIQLPLMHKAVRKLSSKSTILYMQVEINY